MDDIRDQYDTGSQGVPSLEAFGVSPTHGFVLGNHLTHLPAYYEPWCTLCRDLSTFIEKRTLQHLIHQMPLLDHTHLKSHRELLIAHAMLSSLASGYVWLNGEKQAPKVLPKRLAVPLCAVSERVGLPPILCHPTLILANVCPKDPSQEMSLGNMKTMIQLSDGCPASSDWFKSVAVRVELASAPSIQGIISGQRSVINDDMAGLIFSLTKVKDSLHAAKKEHLKVHEHLLPEDFYSRVRPFFAGWTGPSHPDGLIYEGVSEQPKKYVGSTGAQSPLLQTLDAGLGVTHAAERAEFLIEMRNYMLPDHKKFIEAIGRGPSIRLYVETKNDSTLTQLYNICIQALADLRSTHVSIVVKYIVIPANKYKNSFDSLSQQGTGGTSIMPFLKGVRDECQSAELPFGNHL